MNTYISLLRGINVSGQKMIKMIELIELYESLKFNDVKTYLQSGNVIFNSSLNDIEKLSGMIEERIERKFGFRVDVLIRSINEFQQIISNNPFLKREGLDTSKLHVTFLSEIPSKTLLDEIKLPEIEVDEFNNIGREIYLFCPNGYGRTKLSNNFFEKKLDVIASTRNWKTVNILLHIAKDEKS